MHKPFLLILFAIGTLCSFSVNCGGSESEQVVQATSSSGDLSIVLASLKSMTGETFQSTETEHFVIVHEAGADGIAATGRALESAYRQFYTVFLTAGFGPTRSVDRLVWICFPGQSGFNRYALRVEGMDLSWLDGYYSTLTNRVAVVQPNPPTFAWEPVNPPAIAAMRIMLASNRQSTEKVLPIAPPGQRLDLTRLTHELAHQLAFNSGLQQRGVMYPVWVSEGLATNFEAEGPANASIVPENAARADSLVAAYTAGELVPLREFIIQTRVPSDPHVSRAHYGQAWAFFRFLMTERAEGLRAYLYRVARLPAGHRNPDVLLNEFVDVFGAPESLESEWNAFVARLAQSKSAPAD